MKVKDFFSKYLKDHSFIMLAGQEGLHKKIMVPEIDYPGLALAGYLKDKNKKRILIFGKNEIGYLKGLEQNVALLRLQECLSVNTPLLILSDNLLPSKEMRVVCEACKIPLIQSLLNHAELLNHLIFALQDSFAPRCCCHGTFVEIFNVGVLIQGDSAVGKSEAALGLIERGHRLISDDLVRVKKREHGILEGYGSEISRNYMEVRGIGIIDIARLFGIGSVREKKSLDIVVKLEVWDDNQFYDRAGLEQKTISILDTDLPYHVLPVKVGRDVVQLLEIIASNYRLQQAGYHSAREFDKQLLAAIEKKEHSDYERTSAR